MNKWFLVVILQDIRGQNKHEHAELKKTRDRKIPVTPGTGLSEEPADSRGIDDPTRSMSGLEATNNTITDNTKNDNNCKVCVREWENEPDKGSDSMQCITWRCWLCGTCNGRSKEIYYECPVFQDED